MQDVIETPSTRRTAEEAAEQFVEEHREELEAAALAAARRAPILIDDSAVYIPASEFLLEEIDGLSAVRNALRGQDLDGPLLGAIEGALIDAGRAAALEAVRVREAELAAEHGTATWPFPRPDFGSCRGCTPVE